MEDDRVFQTKLELLKLEMNILCERINSLSANVWNIRHICLTLWVAGLTIGLGVLFKENKSMIGILCMTALVPCVFMLIDAKVTNWYFCYELRDSEIREFMNLREYILPSTMQKISFEKCLSSQVLNFPVYDLTGSKTLGKDELYFWHTKALWSFFATPVPLIYYSFQILISVAILAWELRNKVAFYPYWLPPLFVFILISGLAVKAHYKVKILKKKRNDKINLALKEQKC